MNLNEGLAVSIRTIMQRKRLSLTEFAEELDISRTALYGYTKGEGNPSTATINHIAQRLGISPAVLANGLAELDHREIALLLLNTIRGVAELTPEDRQRFLKQFVREMVRLWDME